MTLDTRIATYWSIATNTRTGESTIAAKRRGSSFENLTNEERTEWYKLFEQALIYATNINPDRQHGQMLMKRIEAHPLRAVYVVAPQFERNYGPAPSASERRQSYAA